MKKKLETSDIVLLFIAVFLIVFIGIMIWLYHVDHGIPDTLVQCVFTLLTCECGFLWRLTVNKRARYENYDNYQEGE